MSTSFSWFLFVGLALAGCANPLEKPLVASRFQDLHGCPDATMRGDGYRWIVEGCGIRARYTCVNRWSNGELLMGDTCVEETSEPIDGPTADDDPPSTAPTERNGTLTTAVRLPEGWFVVRATPRPDASIVTRFQRDGTATAGDACDAHLLADGESIAATPRKEQRELVIPISDFRRLAHAHDVGGTLCGRPFNVDKLGRARLEAFVTRFDELTPHPAVATQTP